MLINGAKDQIEKDVLIVDIKAIILNNNLDALALINILSE
jgi:hypothetical protein